MSAASNCRAVRCRDRARATGTSGNALGEKSPSPSAIPVAAVPLPAALRPDQQVQIPGEGPLSRIAQPSINPSPFARRLKALR